MVRQSEMDKLRALIKDWERGDQTGSYAFDEREAGYFDGRDSGLLSASYALDEALHDVTIDEEVADGGAATEG